MPSVLPVQVEPHTTFLGTHEGINPVVLPDVFSPSGSQNVWLDELGRVKRIDGYAKQNSSAFTTDTGATAARVMGLFPYRKISGGSTTRQLMIVLDDGVDEWELHYSTDQGATKTFIHDYGSGSINRIPSFAQYKNNLYLANGVIAPQKWDGSSIVASGLTQSPTPTASVVSATVGALDGQYSYKLVSVKTDGTRAPGSVTSNIITVSKGVLSLAWTLDSDVTVTGYEVYRTTGVGAFFYYVGFVTGRAVVTYTDTFSDNTILEHRSLAEHGDAPPSGTYLVVTHGDRMWYLRTDTNPARGYYSDLALPDSVGSFSYMDFSDPEQYATEIRGGLGNLNKKLTVWTDRGVWTVSGTGQVIGSIADWTKKRSNAGTGAASGRAIIRVPSGALYRDVNGVSQQTASVMAAYLTPLLDIRIFDGDNDVIISNPVKDSLALLNYAAIGTCHAVHDTQRGLISFYYPSGSATRPDHAVVWNYRYGTWHRWLTLPFMAAVEVDSSTAAATLLTGEAETTKGGYIYKFFSGNSFDGSAIDARWMTNNIYGRLGEDTQGRESPLPALPYTKRYRWLDLTMMSVSGVTLTVEWFPGNSPEGATATSSTTLTPSDTSRESTQKKVFLHDSHGDYLHDTAMRLRIGNSSSSTSGWAVEAFTIGFQILPGLNRRSQ